MPSDRAPMFSMRRAACVAAAALACTAGVAVAQDAMAAPQPEPLIQAWAPSWSDPMIADIAQMLSGSWVSSQPVGELNAEGGTGAVDVMINIAPAPVDGMNDTLFVEAARADSLSEPFRYSIVQLFRHADGVRMRTYELRMREKERGVFTGAWAFPELFPALTADDLIATIDIDLRSNGGGYAGSTPHAYPTGVGGAVEMTSEVSISPDMVSFADRGLDASGNVVWGPEAGEADAYQRTEAPVTVMALEGGMVVLEYQNPGEMIVQDGDRMHVHYSGWLEDGTQFDSSYNRGRPFIFAYPPGTQAIQGWGMGMDETSIGTRRRLVIPGPLAYGERGNPRANIPANATLYFDINVMHLDRQEPTPAPAPQPNAEPAPE
ncbi:MAG: CpcT/CpeT family chromophore lyase [Planctomycetota bacterium]